jgi:hypothetical protein
MQKSFPHFDEEIQRKEPEMIPMIEVACKRCGKKRQVAQSEVKKGKHNYCSSACGNKRLSVNEEIALKSLLEEKREIEIEIRATKERLKQLRARKRQLKIEALVDKFDLSRPRIETLYYEMVNEAMRID